MKILFMGTPEFAVPCLAGLLEGKHEVAAVFTQPDRPRGRGYKLEPPPVKTYALGKNLPVHQPKSLRDGEAPALIHRYQPDIIVVVAYGKILPSDILSAPKLGCVNVHASLLPKLRGASPIQSAIVLGEQVTGVTTMQMDEGMDTGDILEKSETLIGPDETSVELHDRLSELGGKLILSTLEGLESGKITPRRQNSAEATYAPILKKEMGRIDWTAGSVQIHNQIRGLQPWPNAFTKLDDKKLKIYKSRILTDTRGKPGELLETKERLFVATGDGALELLEVQLEGAKRMETSAMLRGRKILMGSFLDG